MNFLILNPRYIADAFDRNIIIANLDSGIYYTVVGSICKLFAELPIEKSAISEYLNQDESLSVVYQQLLEEGILIECDEATECTIEGLNPKDAVSKLNKFDDLQDLLVLDPIHEVESDRWKSESKK